MDSDDYKMSQRLKIFLLDYLINFVVFITVFYPTGMIGFVFLMFSNFLWRDAIYYIFFALNPLNGLKVCMFGTMFTFLYLLCPLSDIGECLGVNSIEENPFNVTDNIFGGMPYCYGKNFYDMIYPVNIRTPEVWYMKPLDDYFGPVE